MSGAAIARVGERALLVRFEEEDLAAAIARAQTLYRRLADPPAEERGSPAPWSTGGRLVLGAGSLLVESGDDAAESGFDALRGRLERTLAELERAPAAGAPRERDSGRAHRIAVRFGGEAGPDLASAAHDAGLSPARVVELLTGRELVVAFVGFAPGFPYLVGLPRELELPRLASPRPRVPAGSVAIAGAFAGIYPSATPGGWRLLGRCDATLFDPRREPPALFAAGDRVRLVSS